MHELLKLNCPPLKCYVLSSGIYRVWAVTAANASCDARGQRSAYMRHCAQCSHTTSTQ